MRNRWNRALSAVSVALVAAWVTGVPPAQADMAVQPMAGNNIPSALSGDFDGDGKSDIALTGAFGWTSVPVARTTSSGLTVTKALAPAFAEAAAKPHVTIATGDVDGDDDDDIVLAGAAGWTTLPVARSNGDGSFTVTFAAAGSFPALAAEPGVRVVSGDFNNDSRMDLALTGGDTWTTVPVAFSTGNAAFNVTNGSAPQFAQEASGDGARVFGGDFDADGRTDLAVVPGVGMTMNPNISVVMSNGDGTFRQASTSLPDFVSNTGGNKIVTADDFNNDGRTDLAVVLADRILVAYAVGSGTFVLHQASASPVFYLHADTLFDTAPHERLVSADVNCDGRADLAAVPDVHNPYETMAVALATADPEVFTVVEDPVANFPRGHIQDWVRVLVGDYNADGCDDLALAGAMQQLTTIPIALSNGDGTFTESNPAAPEFVTWAGGMTRPVNMPPPPATVPFGNMAIHGTGALTDLMTSSTVGTDGLPIIAYRVTVNNHFTLRVAHCNDQACTTSTTTDVDGGSGRDTGVWPSIKIGSDGLPVISYVESHQVGGVVSDDLKVAHCNNITCSSARVDTVDMSLRVRKKTSLTIGADGLPVISYQHSPASSPTGDVKVAYCQDIACDSTLRTTIATVPNDGGDPFDQAHTPIATGIKGFPIVAYHQGGSPGVLDLTICGSADCRTGNLGGNVDQPSTGPRTGLQASATVGLDGFPLVAYAAPDGLRVLHCSDAMCGQSTKTTVDTAPVGGTSIAIGGDGLGVISYYDSANDDLKVAHCVNLACSTVTTTPVDQFDNVGSFNSISIGTDGLPLISFVGPGTEGANALRVVHCGNPDCTAPIVAPF